MSESREMTCSDCKHWYFVSLECGECDYDGEIIEMDELACERFEAKEVRNEP